MYAHAQTSGKHAHAHGLRNFQTKSSEIPLLWSTQSWKPYRSETFQTQSRLVCLSSKNNKKKSKTVQKLTKPYKMIKRGYLPPSPICVDQKASFGRMPELPWSSLLIITVRPHSTPQLCSKLDIEHMYIGSISSLEYNCLGGVGSHSDNKTNLSSQLILHWACQLEPSLSIE